MRIGRKPAIGLLVGLIAVALPPVLGSDQWTQIFLLMVIYGGLASGLNLLVGYTGLLDLGYIAFYAVGAYTTALLTSRVLIDAVGIERYSETLWWVPYLDLIPAAALAAVFAAILGYPTLRARGDYLAIMTLGLGEIVRIVAVNWTGLTRGSSGIPGIPAFALGEEQFFAPLQMYYAGLAIVAVLLAVIWGISRSHLARVWMTIREDEVVAESLGIRTSRYKLAAYVVGGAIAGCVGVVLAHTQQYVNPDSFLIDQNFVVLALVIIGGRGTLLGPLIGAVVWVGIDQAVGPLQFVQDHPETRELFLGAVVMLALILAPNGLASILPGRRAGSAAPDAGTDPEPVTGEDEPLSRLAVPGLPTRGEHDPDPLTGVLGPDAPGTELTCTGLTRAYGGVRAVNEVSLHVRSGEVLGVIGPNGAGKTTLINLLSGLERPTSGQIRVGDRPVRLNRPSQGAELGVSRTFQLIRVLGTLSVLENVLIGAHLHDRGARGSRRWWRPWAGERGAHGPRRDAMAVLGFVGLAGQAGRPAASLSYGDRRRLELARSIMTRPRFLMLDEPAAGMNSSESARLAPLIRDLARRGVGVVLVEHDVRLVLDVCDRVVVLDQGKKVTEGSPREVTEHPEVISAYLGEGG
jgi:branched-chain amino acid transport system ATP-binding protein/branched-chain amino acid transport system permease protein